MVVGCGCGVVEREEVLCLCYVSLIYINLELI